MNWDQVEGRWKQLRGKVKERWGRLQDNDLDVIRGRREQLVGKVQEIYGIVRGKAEKQVSEFARGLFSPKPGRALKVRIRISRSKKPAKGRVRLKARGDQR